MPTPHYGQPRYRAIADELKKRIESGAIPPGTLLPAEGALAADFRASRGTIRQAIAILRDTGLVATEHGRGTFVYPHPHTNISGKYIDLKSGIQERLIDADQELAALFAVEVGTTLIEEESVTRQNGTVDAVVRVYRLP
ncbi:GntR family transcriptional regulator [Micromonospora chalcea]|uniref:GntR family transcriptional regulator n=1 Tax=Micromonospora chalcea TaxID=1874 RepID=UPI00380D21CF